MSLVSNRHTVRGTSRPRSWLVAAGAAALALGLVLGVPVTAQADRDSRHDRGQGNSAGWYLALGDSLAAGYQPGRTPPTDYEGGYVGRTLEALREEKRRTRLTNLSCPGATSVTMVDGGGACSYRQGNQLDQALAFLHRHGRHTRLITLTVGANDVTPCLGVSTDPAVIQACATQRLQTVGTNLTAMLTELSEAAPRAEIVVTNYYNPYLALYFDTVRSALVPLTTQLQTALNQTLAAASAGRAEVADVATTFSSYVTAPVSATNPTPTNVAMVCAWTWMCTPYQDIHANEAGYAAIAEAIAATF